MGRYFYIDILYIRTYFIPCSTEGLLFASSLVEYNCVLCEVGGWMRRCGLHFFED